MGRSQRHEHEKGCGMKTETIATGIEMGSALAMIMSWEANHSILWAMLHGVFGWGYVIYRAVAA